MTPSSGELFKFDTLALTFSLVPVAASLEGETPEDRSFHVLTSYKVRQNSLWALRRVGTQRRSPDKHELSPSFPFCSPSPPGHPLPSRWMPSQGTSSYSSLPRPLFGRANLEAAPFSSWSWTRRNQPRSPPSALSRLCSVRRIRR